MCPGLSSSRCQMSGRPSEVRCEMRRVMLMIAAVALVGTPTLGWAQGIDAIEREMVGLVDDVGGSIVSVAAFARQVAVTPGVTSVSKQPVAKSIGCGVVFDETGLILTTASVVGYARQVEVGTRDGAKYTGTVVGSDPISDLAIVKVEGADLMPAAFAEGRLVMPGSLILVLGNAFGSLPSVSMGVVSGIDRQPGRDEGSSMLRVSVPINPGDIGGPVVNTRGEVTGILIGRLTVPAGHRPVWVREGSPFGVVSNLEPSNMGLAIPASAALAKAREIMKTGRSDSGFLGVRVVNLSDEARGKLRQQDAVGVVVVDVIKGSPAESIGIVPGDLITAFASEVVESVTVLRNAVRATTPGDIVGLTYMRDSRPVSEAVRMARSIPEYIRHVSFREQRIGPEEVRARIDDLKAEIELLRAQLKEIEKQQ